VPEITVRSAKGKFLRIGCPRCGSPQIIYGKAASLVKCDNCNKLLIKTTGGKSRIMACVKEIYGT